MDFTNAQKDAMTARGRSILVSAAAGSGKTFTLTKRVIDTIINDETKSISRMLIVTFTRSAAAELKRKIALALSEAIAEHPEKNYLHDEILKLGSAHISTIDSFFSAPVKANFEKLGLPASLRLADEAELTPLRESIFKDTLDYFFNERSGLSEGEIAEVGHRSDYTDLLSLISGIRDSASLIPFLLDLYKKTLTGPDGVKILKKSADRLRASADLDFFDTLEGKIILDHYASILEETSPKVDALLAETAAITNREFGAFPTEKYAIALKEQVLPVIQNDASICQSMLSGLSVSYSALYGAVCDKDFDDYPRLKEPRASEFSAYIRDLRKPAIAPLKDLKKSFLRFSPEEISEHFKTSADICQVLYELLAEFDRLYSDEKLSRGICEFSDMPIFMLRLLQNKDGSLTNLALSMQQQYDEVYIDEYQDVNAIQDRIFEIIGGNRRFMVGDIKQSIYCFRDAEPSIFAGYREKFPLYDRNLPDDVPESGGSSIFMSENFRCDRGVVDFVNFICDKIFLSFKNSIGYEPENDKLKFGKTDPHFDPPQKVIINIIEPAPLETEEEAADDAEDNGETIAAKQPEDNDKTNNSPPPHKLYDEAIICANEIARLIRDKNEVKANGKKVVAGDIAILVRGNAQIAPIAEALTKLGIKYVTDAKSELLQGDEMKLLADILTIIDNPRNDVPLYRVLSASLPSYSPILTLDELLPIINTKEEPSRSVTVTRTKEHSLYDSIIEYGEKGENETIAQKCQAFVKMLDDFRKYSTKVSADKLLRVLSRHPTFAKLCESDSYTYLYNTACNYVKNAWNGLYSFITYFKYLLEKGEGASDPVKAENDEVTISTMHHSKGLEYNICFLFGLGKQFNMSDGTSPIIFERELGVSMKLPSKKNEDDNVYSRTQTNIEENLLWRSAAILSKNKTLEEEARVFYVAMTRAKERLYLSATITKPYKDLEASLTPEDGHFISKIRGSNSYLSWLLIALSGEDKESLPCKIIPHQRGKIPPLADRLTREEVEAAAYGITEEDKSFAKTLLDSHSVTDEEKKMAMIPAKVAASKVSPTVLDESVFIPTPMGDIFSDSDEDRGDISADNKEQIEKRIELMQSRHVAFDSILEINKKPTAAEKGTAAHLILQFCDFDSFDEGLSEDQLKRRLDAEINRLKDDKFISERVAEIVERDQLMGFFKSKLFGIVRNVNKNRRHTELRFGLFRPAADFTADADRKKKLKDKKIFVQGSIDLLLETEDGIILCDYKTDRITDAERDDRELLKSKMKEKYAGQLEAYRFAVKEIFGKEPARIFIYSVPLGDVIDIL